MIWRKNIDRAVFLKNSLSLRSEWNLQSFPSWMILKGQMKRNTEEGEVLRNYNIYMCPLHVLAMENVIPWPDLPSGLSRLRLWIFPFPFAFYYKEKQQCSILHVKSVHRPVKLRTIRVQKALGVQHWLMREKNINAQDKAGLHGKWKLCFFSSIILCKPGKSLACPVGGLSYNLERGQQKHGK